MYVTREFKKDLAALTGRRAFMHLDRGGVVVVGVGHVVGSLEAAHGLPLFDPATSAPAAADQIDRCWASLMECRDKGQFGSEFLPEFYREGAPVLDEGAEERLLEEDVTAALLHLRSALPRFDRYPQAARELVVELALHINRGEAFLGEERWAALRDTLLAEDWEGLERLVCVPGQLDEPGRLGEERRRWRAERLARAREVAAAEADIEEKVDLLVASLGTLADTARTEMKKIEAQVGELAEELVSKAREFLKDLGARMAEVNLEEAIRKDQAQRESESAAAPISESESAAADQPGQPAAGSAGDAGAASAPDDHVV